MLGPELALPLRLPSLLGAVGLNTFPLSGEGDGSPYFSRLSHFFAHSRAFPSFLGVGLTEGRRAAASSQHRRGSPGCPGPAACKAPHT